MPISQNATALNSCVMHVCVFFMFSLHRVCVSCPRVAVCLCICCFNTDSAHQAAHRVLSIPPAGLFNNKLNPLCLSSGPTLTRLHCPWWHTSPISMMDLNASRHQHGASTAQTLMQDTVGCLQWLVHWISVATVTLAFVILLSPPSWCELQGVNPVIYGSLRCLDDWPGDGV